MNNNIPYKHSVHLNTNLTHRKHKPQIVLLPHKPTLHQESKQILKIILFQHQVEKTTFNQSIKKQIDQHQNLQEL